jgi:hypothetical protein
MSSSLRKTFGAGSDRAGAAALPSSRNAAAPHCRGHVDRLWLDQLLSEGDPGDLISMLHRYRAWLDLEDEARRG